VKKYFSFLRSLLNGKVVVDYKMAALNGERKLPVPQTGNYIRISTFELAVREISERNIPGATAEVGVYRGDFAKYINQAFPDRKLYLFDTFEGFDKNDTAIEQAKNFGEGNQDFSNTSTELVLSKMTNKNNCIVKQGRFPASLNSLEENFCFVSLDADLYEPIYQGLVYFYPRLSKGGYIFIHDYNNKHYSGAKQAVREYCEQHQIGYVPVSDEWGTVVITK
jgi:O-methyltransferase